MKQRVVSRLGHAAAAGGDDQRGLFAQLGQRSRLPVPENGLAVLCKNGRDGLARKTDNFLVGIHQLPAELLCKQSADGAFSAPRHSDEDDVRHLGGERSVDFGNDGVINGRSGKILGGFLGLCHQHPKAVGAGNVERFSIQQQLGAGGVVDHVQHSFQSGKTLQIHQRNAGVGVHADGGCVDNGGGVFVALQIFIIILPGTGNDNSFSAQFVQNRGDGIGSAAAAQHQNLLSGGVQAASFQKRSEAKIVRVVAEKSAVISSDDGVHRPQLFRCRGQFVQIGNNRFLVGNGDVQPGKIPIFQEIPNFLRLFFKESVGIVTETGVNLGGVAVPQLPSQQSAFHQTTSV